MLTFVCGWYLTVTARSAGRGRSTKNSAVITPKPAANAGKSIDKLTAAVAQTGADVVGGLEVKRNHLDQHTDLFVERLLDVVQLT